VDEYKRIKGTQDIYGPEIDYWNHVEKTAKSILEKYAFKELRTPVIEPTELFNRGIGNETDIVKKEMYTFEDKGGRSITLRPEGTAPAVRAYIENSMINSGLPVKLFYFGPMFRYEKPQSGRLRQFHQFGAEIFGSDYPLADAEIVIMLNNILSSVGLRNYRLKINSVGCPKCRAEYRKALKEYFAKYLSEMCEDCQSRYEKNPMRLLDCKVQKDKEYARQAPSILDYLCEECRDHFDSVKKYLDLSHVAYEVDPRIVRGLDYYTKTAFEFEHLDLGAQAVIAGGGRYDGLVQEIGGPSTPSVGFGMGVERVVLAMKAEKVQFLCSNDVDVYIVHSGKGTEEQALELTNKLRSNGIKAYISVVKRNMSGQFKHANKIGARLSIVIGEDELTNNFYTVKNMVTGDQSQVEKEWVTDIIKEKLEGI